MDATVERTVAAAKATHALMSAHFAAENAHTALEAIVIPCPNNTKPDVA